MIWLLLGGSQLLFFITPSLLLSKVNPMIFINIECDTFYDFQHVFYTHKRCQTSNKSKNIYSQGVDLISFLLYNNSNKLSFLGCCCWLWLLSSLVAKLTLAATVCLTGDHAYTTLTSHSNFLNIIKKHILGKKDKCANVFRIIERRWQRKTVVCDDLQVVVLSWPLTGPHRPHRGALASVSTIERHKS